MSVSATFTNPGLFWICVLLPLILLSPLSAADRVQSPDGTIHIEFSLQTGGRPAYAIQYLDKPVVLESQLGFEPEFLEGFEIITSASSEYRGQWTNSFGERRIIPDNYHQLDVDLKHKSGWLMRITLRAYNEGAALRYSFPKQADNKIVFAGEHTEFRFPAGTYGYEEHGTEGEYKRASISSILPWCERPLTLEYTDGFYACLAEAANADYPRMLISCLPNVPDALVSTLGGRTANTDRQDQVHDSTITLSAPSASPWRMLIIGRSPGELLERNYLMLNLNPPSEIKDTSWIKPGKVMRDITRTTDNSKAIIDFAATAGLQYVLLDAGWYGSEDAAEGDARTTRVPSLDIPEIIRYGNQKNVGLLLYVDRRQIKKQRDILFPLYEQWGVKGIKLGFVQVGPQSETAWITETIQKAAACRLMLNIHDGYRATGNNRTWPNLLTVEGIRGNEHMPTPEHNTTLPFTRYIAGIGDYTVCYYTPRKKTTCAHQLAMAVVSFSPLQWIFWYDKPSDYHQEPEIEFFKQVPTVWEDTKVLDGKIGQYAAIARQSGDEWFVGIINNSQARTLRLPLSMLEQNKNYTAHIYADDDSVNTRTKVGIKTIEVNSKTVLDVPLKPAGGQAMWITLSSEKK